MSIRMCIKSLEDIRLICIYTVGSSGSLGDAHRCICGCDEVANCDFFFFFYFCLFFAP